ncbi:MAG: HU family DNA-binding protein [Desulfurobacteriaceae bacterium]
MTRNEVAEIIAKELGVSKTRADKALAKAFMAIAEELQNGGKVSLSGLGTFYWKEKKGRRLIHPRTKEEIRIPNRFVLRFEPTKALRYRKAK